MIIVKVWDARIKRKLTLSQLSQLTGIAKSTLSDIENNRVDPKISQLDKIAIALAVPIEGLYESVLDGRTVIHRFRVLGNRIVKYFKLWKSII